MNRLSAAITAILFFCIPGNAAAIPTLGTVMPKGGEFQGGGRADIILDRDVKDYDKAKSAAFTYVASYGFADWFAIDGQVGLGDVRARYIGEDKLRYPYNFSGGYGLRAKLYKNDRHDIDWIFAFQHVSTHPGQQDYRNEEHHIIWDEWQLSTIISRRMWSLTPYCGMKWSFIYLIDKVDGDRHRRLSNDAPIGLVVGTDLRMNDYIYLNVESRFFDETALNAGFTIRY